VHGELRGYPFPDLRGFARALDHYDTMDSALFVRAMQEARNTAYKGVVRPVEGTILTVIKDMTAAAEEATKRGAPMHEILAEIVRAGDESVRRTPELLPILKQAGVVDSGGTGLYYIFEGMLRFIEGQPLDVSTVVAKPLSEMDLQNTLENIEEGQDYEVVIDFTPTDKFSLENYYSGLSEIGTSIQVGEGDGLYRMHIHVPLEKRFTPIEYTESLGTIKKVAMENLQDQVKSRKDEKEPIKLAPVSLGQIAVVAVSPGDGISRIFASLGQLPLLLAGKQ